MLTLMSIKARSKQWAASAASFSDFDLQEAGSISADAVLLDAAWSLYALDLAANQAMFVRLPVGHDLTAAAFVYTDQFDLAQEVVVMPLDQFVALSKSIATPDRVSFLLSTGRCGSTLASRILAQVPDCFSLSEPDCFSHLVRHRFQFSAPETAELIRAATLWLCRGAAPDQAIVIKPRSEAVLQAESYHQAFPEASMLFLYRDHLGFANSSFRFMQRVTGTIAPAEPEETWRPLWPFLMVGESDAILDDLFAPDHGPIGWEEFVTLMWDLRMEACLVAARRGVPFQAFHYTDLNSDRKAETLRLLLGCRLSEDSLPLALKAFEADSHKGSSTANSTPARGLSDQERARATALLRRLGKPDYLDTRLFRTA
jgi:hypothetical protein